MDSTQGFVSTSSLFTASLSLASITVSNEEAELVRQVWQAVLNEIRPDTYTSSLSNVAQVQRLSWFASWFSSLEETPTAVIDGPNVAYMGQNHPGGSFRLEQVSQ